MKNPYFKNLEKIEFVLTYACTGRCKHCSEGEHSLSSPKIDPKRAAYAVRKICSEYDIKTVMVFGGEPLLHPEAVKLIMSEASKMNVPRRQIITNGYFTRDREKMSETSLMLSEAGVNDVLLSVDAFHQETIPIDTVRGFATEIKVAGIPMRLQPAWLVSEENDNVYNRKTREILDAFSDMQIPVSRGNVIFPEGNALKYLSEYFAEELPENPYTEDPCNLKCVSIEPNGDTIGGNIYETDVMEIICRYAPSDAL